MYVILLGYFSIIIKRIIQAKRFMLILLQSSNLNLKKVLKVFKRYDSC